MKKLLVGAVLSLASVFGLATDAQAGESFLLLEDKDDLPPPYKQWWYATPSEGPPMFDGIHEVFIRGDGKHGDFFGILAVNCPNSSNSEWLATGGYLLPEDVPFRAITKLRLEICNDGKPA